MKRKFVCLFLALICSSTLAGAESYLPVGVAGLTLDMTISEVTGLWGQPSWEKKEGETVILGWDFPSISEWRKRILIGVDEGVVSTLGGTELTVGPETFRRGDSIHHLEKIFGRALPGTYNKFSYGTYTIQVSAEKEKVVFFYVTRT